MKKIIYVIGIVLGLLVMAAATNGATVLFPVGGGTGTSTAPTYGQLLMGNGNGTYSLVATSSLGITGGWGLTGNAGLNASTNFLGTTDDIDVVFKRNGVESFRLSPVFETNDLLFAQTEFGLVTGSPSVRTFYSSGGTTEMQAGNGSATSTFRANSGDGFIFETSVVGGAINSLNVPARFYNSGLSNYVGIAAPSVLGSSLTFTLPSSGGITGVVTSNASNQLSVTATSSLGLGITGTQGQVAYLSGTNTAVGTSSLFISTASNVGVGTTTPQFKLDVNGTSIVRNGIILPNFYSSSFATNPQYPLQIIREGDSTPSGILFENYNDSSVGAAVFEFKKAGGTYSSPTNAGTNAQLGVFDGKALNLDNLGDFDTVARIDFSVDGSVTAAGSPGKIRFYTEQTTTLTERMAILSTGSVTVGTTTCYARFCVRGAGNTTGTTGVFNSLNSLERFKIMDNGNIGIGTSSPGTILSIGSSTNSVNISNTATSTFTKAVFATCFSVDNSTCLTTTGAPAYTSSGAAFSGLRAATTTNALDNTNYAQTWNWSTAATENALAINTPALTSGDVLTITASTTGHTGALLVLNSSSTSAFNNGGLLRANLTGNYTGTAILVNDASNSAGTSTEIIRNTAAGGALLALTATSKSTNVLFIRDSSNLCAFGVSGAGLAATCTSDQRLKKNIKDADPVLDKLMSIRMRQFDWDSDGSHEDYGWIAQELLNSDFADHVNLSDPDGYYTVEGFDDRMYIKAIQELYTIVKNQQAEINLLKANNN